MNNEFKRGVCVPCLRQGHDCPAIDIEWQEGEERKCAFCEDGLPCPKASRAAPSPAPTPKTIEKKAAAPQSNLVERVTQYNGGVTPKEMPMEQKRKCGHEGCEKRITAANRSGFCTEHFYDSKRKAPGSIVKPVTRRADATVRHRGGQSNGHSKTNDVGVLQVSRNQLVAMFSAWPLDDQVGCVQMWLNQMSRGS